MKSFDFRPASKPTFYFIGVTTSRSSIMKVFPRWAEHLGLGDVALRGIDCAVHDEPAVYRRIVAFLKDDPLSLGAAVTTHKIHLLGAGGSSLALTTYLMHFHSREDLPTRIRVTNRSKARLESTEAVHAKINPGIPVTYVHAENAERNDAVVGSLPPRSLVVNATGLGKDAPGSPLTEAAVLPMNGAAWDFNHRGDLVFLDQARAQTEQRKLHIEDGWLYFIYGWLEGIAQVFDVDVPLEGRRFEEIRRIAEETRM